MASLLDVETALVGLIAAPIYPNGTPPAGASAAGHPVKVYPGWPDPQQLDADMVETAGYPAASHVSIYSRPGGRNTTRYPVVREELPAPAATYTLSAVGQEVTVGGAAPGPYVAQNLAVYLDNAPYHVQATAGQTAADVAAALTAAIAVDYPAVSLSGAVITIPSGVEIGALRVGSTGSTIREVRRQEQQFQVSVWTSSPALRDRVDSLFDPVLADTPRFTLPDGSIAHLVSVSGFDDDFPQKQRIYRRTRLYTVEYATTITESAAQMIVGVVEVQGSDGIDLIPIVTLGLGGTLDLGSGGTLLVPLY